MNTSKPKKTPLLAPTKPRVFLPRVPATSTSTSSSTSSSTSLLGKLGSFNRKKIAKQSVKSDNPTQTVSQPRKAPAGPLFALETNPDTSYPSNWQKLKLRPAAAEDETEVIAGKRPREKGVEAPWTSYLRRAAKEAKKAKAVKGKGKEKEIVTRVKEEVLDDDDDEVLVAEKSWETPSDRSTPPSLDEPGPSSLRQLSLDPIHPHPPAPPIIIKSEPRSSYPVHPSRAFSPLPPAPSHSTSSFASHPPPSVSQPVLDPGYIHPNGTIQRSLTATWSVLHLGGFWSTIPPHEIWEMVTPPHLPRPIAMRINRKPNVHYCPTFVAYSTPEEAEEAVKGLKFTYGEGKGKGRISPSWSDKPASSITWSSGESVDAWEELARMVVELEEDPQIDPNVYVPTELIQGYITLQIDDLPMSILRDEVFSYFPSDLVAGVSLPTILTSELSNPTATKTGYLLFSSIEKRDAVIKKYLLEPGNLPGKARSVWYGEVEKPTPWRWDEMEQEWIWQRQGGALQGGSNPTTSESTRDPPTSVPQPTRRLPLPPPPPPPPAPRPPHAPKFRSTGTQPPRPSQAILESLLSQLRRAEPHDPQLDEQPPLFPLVTYDAASDPRRKRRKLV